MPILLMAGVMLAWMPGVAPPAAAEIVPVDPGDGARPNVGSHTSLELDAAGNPVISYGDGGIHAASNLKLAHCNDPHCVGGDESIVTVDTGGPGGNVGWHTSLELDAAGNPVISYWNAGHGDLKLAHCNDPNCAGGDESIVTVDSQGSVGRYTSLELTSGGLVTPPGVPVIAYYDETNGDLKVTQCGDVNCVDPGPRPAVDTGGNVGLYASLELASIAFGDQVAMISYHDATNGDLKLAMCAAVAADCGGMTAPFVLDTEGVTGLHTSFSLFSSGFFSLDLSISYFDATNGDLKVVDMGLSIPDDGLEITTIDSAGVVGPYSSLTRNAAGQPVIAYRDDTNQDLKIATCGGGIFCTGTTPTIATVDSGGAVGQYASAQYDAAAGRAVVSYYDASNGDLKVLTDDSPTGAFEPVANPQPAAVDEIDVIFSEPVTGVDVNDFRLTRDGEQVALDGVAVGTSDGITWTLTGLGPLTTGDLQGDDYVLELVAGHGIVDSIANPLGSVASVAFTVDPLPVVAIDGIGPELRTDPPGPLMVRFSEPVTGFTNGDIAVSRDGNPLNNSLLLVTALPGGMDYMVRGLGELDIVPGGKLRDGTYLVEIAGGVQDSGGQDVVEGTSITFTIDNTAPVPMITFDPATPDGDNDWWVSPVGVTVTAVEPHLDELRCVLDPATAPQSFDDLPGGPCNIGTVDTNGSHVVYAGAIDLLEHESNVVGTAFRIDLHAPTTFLELDPSIPSGDNGWYTTPVGIEVSADEPDAETRCAVDPTDAPDSFDDLPTGTCPASVATDGDHVVYAASGDEAGHTSPVVQTEFRIDLTAPVTTITLDPAEPDGDDDEYASPVAVTVTADDEAATIRCAVSPGVVPAGFDDLPDAPCDIGTVEEEGEYTVYAASIDEAGNASALAEATFDIDMPFPATPPQGNLTLTVSDTTPQPGQTIALSASGFAADETVEVVIYSEPVLLTTATVDATGALATEATIPSDAAIGSHTLAVYGDDDTATATIEVTAAPSGSGAPVASGSPTSGSPTSGGDLASTGGAIAVYVGSALAALALGALLVAASRRARRATVTSSRAS
jgi:hypothetical protein